MLFESPEDKGIGISKGFKRISFGICEQYVTERVIPKNQLRIAPKTPKPHVNSL